MPRFTAKCSYCGEEFPAYQRPNRPKQKKWYCCLEHYFISGNKRGGGATCKKLQERGYYIREREKNKLKQIQLYGKRG